MKILSCHFIVLALCADESNAYSIFDMQKAQRFSQKSVVEQAMAMTRREPIRMPSSTPMVPYKVGSPVKSKIVNLMVSHYHRVAPK